jgi:hypothetical protein
VTGYPKPSHLMASNAGEVATSGRLSSRDAGPSSPVGDPFLYTLPAAATALNRAEVTLRRWVRKGLVPFIKINGRYYIDRQALGAFVQSHNHPLPDRPSELINE